jgi:Predicted O-methyltransferase
VRVGAALESLPVIEAEKGAPFDFFFIDADKVNNPITSSGQSDSRVVEVSSSSTTSFVKARSQMPRVRMRQYVHREKSRSFLDLTRELTAPLFKPLARRDTTGLQLPR